MNLRIIRLGVVLGGTIASASAVLAQNVPQQFVVSGKAAENSQDFTTINLATAQRIAEACEQAVAAQGGQHTIMILDNDGNRVYSDRMDGQGYLNIVTAEMKARTALMGRAPSKNFMNMVTRDPTAEFRLIQMDFYPVAGGLPIIVNKQMIGVVGVGGFRPNPPVWSDEICAHQALVQVIGQSVPPLGEDLPPRPATRPGAAVVPSFATATPPKSSLPAEFVIGSKAASNVFDGNQISLAAAKKIARACRDWEASEGGTAAIYILDTAGELVHMERMDGLVARHQRTAIMKAQTALRTRQPTSVQAADVQNNPGSLPRTTMFFDFFAVSGGIPIVVDGQMIGAVGVGGAAKFRDEECAVAGLKAAFGERVTLPVYPAGAGPPHL